MKKKKTVKIFVLLIIIVLLLILYFALKNYNRVQEDKEETKAQSDIIFSFDEDDIKNLSFLISGERVSFTKSEEKWTYDNDESFPVNADQMTVLTDSLAEVTANRTLENVENLSDYGLDEPEDIIQITDANDEVTTITVGDTNDSTGDCYVYLNEDNQTVYTVNGDLATVFSGSLMNYAEGEDYPAITASDINKIELSQNENSFVLEKSDESTSGWVLTDASGNQTDVSSSYASTLQSTVAGFTYANYYEYNCSDYSVYGLDQPFAILTVDYTETVTSDDSEEESEEEVKKEMILYIGNESDDGNRYVYTEGSKEVHGISTESLSEILEPSDSNIEDLSVSNVPMTSLENLTVEYNGSSHVFEVSEETVKSDSEDESEETTETVYYRDNEKIDSLSFSSFYNQAIGMTAQETTEENPVNETEMTLIFKKKDGTSVTVEYSSFDTNFYLAERQDGKKYLVNKMNVRELFSDYEAIKTAE